MTSQTSNSRWTVLLPVFAALALTGLWFAGMPGTGDGSSSLVVYCAHDSVYADAILKDFERQTGIHVDVRYDTEATKSLGLVNLIVAERQRPRCDVFWNNELLGTVDLHAQGLLEPYKGTGWERLPDKYRDADGHWVGFGARLRVQIVNTQQLAADDESMQSLFTLEPSKAAVAKPLFGTTLTHYTVLWHEWGPERLKAWHHDLRLRGVREVDGNGAVKDLVAQGVCDAGLTDTDDFFVALDDGRPVEMLPVRVFLSPSPRRGGRGRGGDERAASDVTHPRAEGKEEPLTLTLSPQSRGEGTKPKAEEKTPHPSPLPTTEAAVPEARGEGAGEEPLTLSPDHRSVGARRGEGTRPKTICIPNTAAIIRGTKRVEAARKLIDFLASADTELALARSKSRQVPLGPVDETLLPKEVRRLKEWAADGIDLRPLLPARRECLQWLKSEYLK